MSNQDCNNESLLGFADTIELDSVLADNHYNQGIAGIGSSTACTDTNSTLNDWEIKNCRVISAAFGNYVTDNIYFQGGEDFKIHHNYIHQRLIQPSGSAHIDNIQFANGQVNSKIYNNICIVDSAVQGHNFILAQHSRNEDYYDTMLVYNNYLYHGGYAVTPNNGVFTSDNIYLRSTEHGYPYGAQTYVINNTLINNNSGIHNIRHWIDGYVSNNIMVQFGDYDNSSPSLLELTNWLARSCGDGGQIVDSSKTNLIWRAWESGGEFGACFVGSGGSPSGTPSNWSSYVNTYGGTGVNENPDLANNPRIYTESNLPYVLEMTSPAINAGTDMRYILNKFSYLPDFNANADIEGNPRDNTPTIGAYEHVVEHGNLESKNNSYSLSQNYPNPFNPSTSIEYYTPQPSQVKLVVYNLIGQEVQTLVDDEKASGSFEVEFNAANLPSGVYFYRLLAANFNETRKMILLR